MPSSSRRLLAGGAVGLLAACTLATASVAAAEQPREFTGGGRGPTVEVAVNAAIEDALSYASGEGLFTCAVVGRPQRFPAYSSERGHYWRAMATVSCAS